MRADKGLLLLVMVLLVSCSAVGPADYAGNQPLLRPEQFFDGKLSAHGVIKNRSGQVIRYFNATIDASWQGDTGTLDEAFLFDDGERQRRTWTLKRIGEGRYTGTAGDVIGEAVIDVAGNSMFLNYVLRIPYNGSTLDIRVDDRMYLVSETVLLNESDLSKFGVGVGSMLLVIEKR